MERNVVSVEQMKKKNTCNNNNDGNNNKNHMKIIADMLLCK